MADQSDIEAALVEAAAEILYPNGSTAPSLLGGLVRIYRGWPNPAALDADLAAGHVNISVFPESNGLRNTTRYPADWQIVAPVEPLLTVMVGPTTATFAGAASPGQIAGVLVDGVTAVHRTTARDTPSIVAAVLADQLRPVRPALANDATLILPGAASLIARVVADQPARMETRRQIQGFRISCWCPDPETRDVITSTLDAALSAQTFLTLGNGESTRLRFRSTNALDQHQDATLYRRDLVYDVEYPTTIAAQLPEMLFCETTFAANGGPIIRSNVS